MSKSRTTFDGEGIMNLIRLLLFEESYGPVTVLHIIIEIDRKHNMFLYNANYVQKYFFIFNSLY